MSSKQLIYVGGVRKCPLHNQNIESESTYTAYQQHVYIPNVTTVPPLLSPHCSC